MSQNQIRRTEAVAATQVGLTFSHEQPATAGEVLAHQFGIHAHGLASAVGALCASDEYGEDELRRCRVSLRRLRCGLRACSEGIDADAAKALSKTIKKFVEPVGIVRDFDVMYALVFATLRTWDLHGETAGQEILRVLAKEREEASLSLANHFCSKEAQRCVTDLLVFANSVPLKRRLAEQSAERYFLRVSRRAWRKIERDRDGLKKNCTDGQLHQLRARVKSTRYTFQASASIHGAIYCEAATRHAKRLAKLQDVLGAHQDCFVTVVWLRALLQTSDDAPSAALARQIVFELEDRMSTYRHGWKKLWKHASTKSTTKWLQG
jgi:CHAD domain-containing protein